MTQVFHVRSWRKKMKWTRKEAAERLGLSVHTIKSYELHRRDLSKPIQQLMERLEEEQNSLMTDESLEPNDTQVRALIVGGSFGQDMNTFSDSFNTSTEIDEEIKNSLMVFRPCLFDASSDLYELCKARGTEVAMLNSNFNQTSALRHVDHLKNQITEAGKRNPEVVFLSCTVPQTRFAFQTIYGCLESHQTKPVIVSFYSLLESDKEKTFSNFGDYLFIEKRCEIDGDENKKKQSIKPMYAVLSSSGDYALAWSKDKELVMAQLLALLYPEGSDHKPQRKDAQISHFEEKNIYKAKKKVQAEEADTVNHKK